MGADTIREFEDQLATTTSTYVEEALTTHFANLAGFVKRAEAAARRRGTEAGGEIPGYGANEAAPIVREFSARWTQSMEALNKWGTSAAAWSCCHSAERMPAEA